MDKLLRNASGTVYVNLVAQSGDLVDPDPATPGVTVTIRNGAGTAIVAAQAATDEAGTGVWSYTLTPAQTAALDTYSADWSATIGGQIQTLRTWFEVVGGFIVSVPDVRAFDADLTAGDYPVDRVLAARNYAEEHLEELLGVALRPRARRATLHGLGVYDLLIPDRFPTVLTSGTIDAGAGAVALTAGELADVLLLEEGVLRRRTLGTWALGTNNVAVYYEHGLTEAPEPLKEAVLELVRARLVRSPLPPGATSYDTDAGSVRLSVAGRDGPTGIPFVDSVVEEFGYGRAPAIG